jgi:hypothetical protein
MVGGGVSSVVTMVMRLRATNMWCVTGTPMTSHGIGDLQGLLRLIRYHPFDAMLKSVAEPFLRGLPGSEVALGALLGPVMWRTSKAMAASDHMLPPRKVQVIVIVCLCL